MIAETEVDLYEMNYPDDYIPVRGDTINYLDNNWRAAVVINSQDNEVTFLTTDNEVKTRRVTDVRVSHDLRMRMLLTLDHEDAVTNRQKFVDDYITNVKAYAEADASAKGASVDSNGNAINKGRGRQLDEARAKEVNDYVVKITSFIEQFDGPVFKTDILDNFSLDSGTYDLVMKRVIAGHKIFKTGQKRGTNYRVAGRVYTEAEDSPKNTKATVDSVPTELLEFIKDNGPASKSMIVKEFKYSDKDWIEIKSGLDACDQVEITGVKRGTRYTFI